jgi:queuine tRNA-ribosyltransferase
MFTFTIAHTDGQARSGELSTPHGTVQTPVFMPVGTHGAVKGVSPDELRAAGTQIILGNTYHLHLRPGEEIVAAVGGLHGFTQWTGPILTDSGGYQVFSLGERSGSGTVRKALRQVTEEGIAFRSHLDGSSRLITPEQSIAIQQQLGADVIMAFDQPVYGMATEEEAAAAMRRTHRWLTRSMAQWRQGDTGKQALFGIVQGGTHARLHRESAEFVSAQDLPGNAIGGLSVGEGKEAMWEAVSSITGILPAQKPRYFMGLGEPNDLIEATRRGVDMYDCVAPTRLARHGVIWQVEGQPAAIEAFWAGNTAALRKMGQGGGEALLRFTRWNLHNQRFRDNPDRLEVPPNLPGFPYATLRHYVQQDEMLGFRLLSLHNIWLLNLITRHLRTLIAEGNFAAADRMFQQIELS